MNKEIYLDCAASSPLTEKVRIYLMNLFEKKLGNSSSTHQSGVRSNLELEKSRITVAEKINAAAEEIYFTSGATESNNLVFLALECMRNENKDEIIISSIEHSSVLQPARYLENKNFKIKYAPVDHDGRIIIEELKKLISPKTLLVSIIHANNEFGVIQDLSKIGHLCREHNVLFHADGAQAFCKTHIDVKEMKLDLYSISGHKLHAPKGVGALYVNSNIKVSPLFHGGSQEMGLRPGTTPVELACALAYASTQYSPEAVDKLKEKRDHLKNRLLEHFPKIRIHSNSEFKLPNIINFALPGVQGKFLLKELDKVGIRVSIGSACNSGNKQASKALLALGLSEEQALEAIRVSWGLETDYSDLDYFIDKLINITSQ